jgi:DNA polymerase-4/DNA polymerase V
MSEPLSREKFPRAIVHFDGDSFFASVEQALNWKLKGRPVVVGAERGAPTAVSVEAKRLGLSRGMSMKQIRAKCPQVVVVNSDYTTYVIYARRMYSIARRFTPCVEEYSIDECFADITGLDEALGKSYEEIAQAIQRELHLRLGITFGVGLGPSKVLAKTASKFRKPAGFTSMPAHDAHLYLEKLPVGSIWGIGPSMALELNRLGVATALEFAQKNEEWLRINNISKPYRQIWSELNGRSIHRVHPEARDSIGSIQKTRTFAPPSSDAAFVFSQLSRNVERACAAARSSGVFACEASFFLKTQEFLYGRREFKLPIPSNDPRLILAQIQPLFAELFQSRTLYRATGISLHHFVTSATQTHDLFGESRAAAGEMPVFLALDRLNKRFGRGTVTLASSMKASSHRDPDRRKKNAKRECIDMPAQYAKKSLNIPYLGKVF